MIAWSQQPILAKKSQGQVMKNTQIFLLILSTLFNLATPTVAKDWRGIMPLHSTREDVARLLGESDRVNDSGARYDLEKEEVAFVFASDEPFFADCVKTLPVGTILLVKVRPKNEIKVRDLQMDGKKFKRFDPSDPPNLGYMAYMNLEAGIIVRALDGIVDEINYIASSKDRYLCADYYKNPEKFVQILVH